MKNDPLSGAEDIELEENEQLALDEVLAEIPVSGSIIKLYKQEEKGSKPAFINEYAPEEFSLGMVKDEYGGGNYVVWVFKPNENNKGKRTLVRKLNFQIHKSFKGRLDNPVVTLQPLTQVQPTQDMSKMVELMMLQSQQANERLSLIMQENSKNQMVMMGGLFQVLAGALNSGSREMKSANSIDDLVKYKMIFPDNSEKAMAMFFKGMELNRGNEPQEKPWWQEALMGLLPAVPPLLETMTKGRATVAPIAPKQTPKSPEEEMRLKQLMLLGELKVRFATACRTSESPLTFSDYLVNLSKSFQEEQIDQVLAVLDQETWLEELEKVAPGALQYKDYLTQVREEILKAFPEDNEPTNPTITTTGKPS